MLRCAGARMCAGSASEAAAAAPESQPPTRMCGWPQAAKKTSRKPTRANRNVTAEAANRGREGISISDHQQFKMQR